jgi:hypothetical protein
VAGGVMLFEMSFENRFRHWASTDIAEAKDQRFFKDRR